MAIQLTQERHDIGNIPGSLVFKKHQTSAFSQACQYLWQDGQPRLALHIQDVDELVHFNHAPGMHQPKESSIYTETYIET